MEIAILILAIVAVIFLVILTFFIFQIWVQSKETKIQIDNTLQELQKGFLNNEKNIKNLILTENKEISDKIELLKSQVREIETTVKKSLSDSQSLLDINLNKSELKLTDSIDQIKITLQENHTKFTERFDNVVESIDQRHKELLKTITEPLKINL